MKFSTRKDIEAPLEFVFARAADFASIERQILRRGVDLKRTSPGDASGTGIVWSARFKIRGKPRKLEATVAAFDAPNGYTVEGGSDGLKFTGTVETIGLSRGRTRLLVSLDMRPTTLSARIIMQSARLAKTSLSAKYDARVAAFAQDIEDHYAARRFS